jgi:acyl carrier protein
MDTGLSEENSSLGLPLQWPDFYTPTERKSVWQRLPLIGWMFSAGLPGYTEVVEDLRQQIRERPEVDSARWGDDPLYQRVGQAVCKITREQYEWPNERFLPDDPVEIVFLMPWDDLEIVEVVMQLEEELGISIEDDEAETWGGTLGDFVERLGDKMRSEREANSNGTF